MTYKNPALKNARLIDLAIRQRALLVHMCAKMEEPMSDVDDIDLVSLPEATLEATRWAEGAIYGKVE